METTVGALLRLLEYVHGEVSERLQGWRCAEQIETRIEHLTEQQPAAIAGGLREGKGF